MLHQKGRQYDTLQRKMTYRKIAKKYRTFAYPYTSEKQHPIVSNPHIYKNNHTSRILLLLLLVVNTALAAAPPPYDDPTVYRINKVNPHAPVVASDDASFHQLISNSWHFFIASSTANIPSHFSDPSTPLRKWTPTSLPSVWDGNGVGCYVHDFTMPESWLSRRTFLKIGAASSAVRLFVNGQVVGYSEDSFTPAEWEITRYLTSGRNRIALCVYSHSDGSLIEPPAPSGILRPVELYSLPWVHIIDFNLVATLDTNDYSTGLLDLTVDLSTEVRRSYTVEIELTDTSQHPTRSVLLKRRRLDYKDWFVSFPKSKNTIGHVIPWSLARPFCYQLNIRLLNDKDSILHNISTAIGFRSLQIKDGHWMLNRDTIQLRGTLWDEPLPPLSVDSLQQTLTDIKQFGFNTLFLSRPASETLYDRCDQIGLMIWDRCGVQTTSDSLANSENFEDAAIYRAHNMVRRDRHHPSIVAWGIGGTLPWGRLADQLMHYFHNRDAQRIACHPDDPHSSLSLITLSSATHLQSLLGNISNLSIVARHRAKPIVISCPQSAGLYQLSLMWDHVVSQPSTSQPHIQGILFGQWDTMSESDRLAFLDIARHVAPTYEKLQEQPHTTPPAAPPTSEITVTDTSIHENSSHGFFLWRWIKHIFRR